MKTKVSVSSLPGSCCIRDCNGLLALSRSLSVSSVSSVSSASSSSSSVRSADSEDMYADLASPVSSASSRSPTPAQQKKGKSKKEDSAKEEKRKRDVPAQLLKSAKPTQGSKSQQLLQTQQPSAPQSQQGGFSAHKEIKLTLLNKVGAIPSTRGLRGADGMDAGARGWRKGSSRLRAVGMSSVG